MTLMKLARKTKKKRKIKRTRNDQGTTTTLIGELNSCEKYFENEKKKKTKEMQVILNKMP